MGAAIVLFSVKFLAFYTGFQYLSALKLFWQYISQDMGDPGLGVLALHALSVLIIAAAYVLLGTPMSGVAGLPKDRLLSREEVDKGFHDTTIGQSIGVSLTPLVRACRAQCELTHTPRLECARWLRRTIARVTVATIAPVV